MIFRASLLAGISLLVACGDDSGGGGGSGGSSTTGATSGSGTTTSSSKSSASGASSGGEGGDGSGGDTSGPGPTSGQVGSTGAGAGPSDGSCATLDVTVCETFEGATDGLFPAGWGSRGDDWGEGMTIGVASDDHYFGAKALKVDGANNGQRFMDYKGGLGSLASHHYGRVFMKVATPNPVAAQGQVLHADFIEGLGPGPNGSHHNVRWGTVGNDQDMHQWIYNVQPSNGDPEFGDGTQYVYDWPGEWQCMEWYYDEPSQSGTLWIDGVDTGIVPGSGGHAPELPVFDSFGVGLANYQPAGDGFTVWFDELALDDDTRVGCGN